MDNILEVRKLSKSYGDKKAVENISFEIHKGDIFAFIGPNGAGKSTTIRSVVGSLEFDKGDVVICGHSVIVVARKPLIPVAGKRERSRCVL